MQSVGYLGSSHTKHSGTSIRYHISIRRIAPIGNHWSFGDHLYCHAGLKSPILSNNLTHVNKICEAKPSVVNMVYTPHDIDVGPCPCIGDVNRQMKKNLSHRYSIFTRNPTLENH